jgi:arabinofuranosyltransferase
MPSGAEGRASRLALAIALVLVTLVFAMAIRQASVVIDGSRYYYLDDDQMISMRYARNLAEGQGLVWNAGEHVEGYTNFGWVLVMAVVHAVGTPDRLASLGVKAVNWALACLVVILTDRLFRRLVPDPPWLLRASLLITTALSVDLLFWAVNGFETTLLTALFVWALVRTVEEAGTGTFTAGTCLIAGLLPVVRSDSPDLTAIVLIVGFLLGLRRRRWLLALAAAPMAAHLGFRLAYYGDWLPNTYYLKVAGRSGLAWLGLGYAKGFVAEYPAALVLAAAAVFTSRDRRVRLLLLPMGLAGLRLVLVGPDMFDHHRFLAPILPIVLVGAAVGIAAITAPGSSGARTLPVLLVVSTLLVSGVNGSKSILDLESVNGRPRLNAITGYMIDRYTGPNARLAVFAAGTVSYFGRRYSIDMLGKTNREIARMPPRPGAPIGHNHFDFDRSLASRPDLVVSFSPAVLAERASDIYRYIYSYNLLDYRVALLTNDAFVVHYLPHMVPLPELRANNALYVRDTSPELAGLSAWRYPQVTD